MYRLTDSDNVVRIADGAVIPPDPRNRDYRDFQDYVAGGGVVESYTPPPITVENVVAERVRRLAAGFDYDFGDARGVHHIGTTAQDMAGWDEVTALANAYVAQGDTVSMIGIVTDTGPVAVTAMEWQAILVAAAAFRQPIWAASFVLQAMSPIPVDYADNKYWP